MEWEVVYHQNYHSLPAYILLIKLPTRAGSQYILLSKVNIVPTGVLPITISRVTDEVVSVKKTGTTWSKLNEPPKTFWDTLMLRNGKWMWDYVSNRTNNTGWMMAALEQGSAILGVLLEKRGPTICGAGWAFACHRSQKIQHISFYEHSASASAYSGELLGLVALHTLVLHTCKHYHLREAKGKIICDSQSILQESGRR